MVKKSFDKFIDKSMARHYGILITFSSVIPLVDGILCEGSSLLRLSSIASVSKLIAVCAVCVTDAFTCLVLSKGGLRDCGNANARLSAPRGGDGGG